MPLSRLLVHALDRKLTGTIVIEAPEHHRSAVFLDRGVPGKVKSGLPVHLLGTLVSELGYEEPSVVDAALSRALAERRLLGQVLLGSGKLTRSDLAEVVRVQVQRKIGWMADLPGDSLAGFYDQVNLLEKWGAPELAAVPPLALLWNVVRDHGEASGVDSALESLGARTLKLHREAQVAGFHFNRSEQALIDVMRAKPQALAALEDCGVLPSPTARRLVFLLGLTRQLDLGSTAPPPIVVGEGRSTRSSRPGRGTPAGRGSSDRPAPIAALTEDLQAYAKELRERVAALPKQTLYEILGVDSASEPAVIQGAFFQLARCWHPDRLPSELHELRDLTTNLFARMSEAHSVLSDLQRREDYNRLLKEGGATVEEQEKVKAVLAAAAAFQRAEILVKRQKLEEAEGEAKMATEGDPDQPEYAALHAWIRGQRADPAARAILAEVLRILDANVEKDPDNIRVRLCRAQTLKRAGREETAMRDYRHIVELRPNHTEALREIRLHRMRHDRGAPPSNPPARAKPDRTASNPGIFGRLFKR